MPQPSRSLSGRLAATMRPLESSTHAGESACSTIATERRSPGRPRRPQCLRNRPFVLITYTPSSRTGHPTREFRPECSVSGGFISSSRSHGEPLLSGALRHSWRTGRRSWRRAGRGRPRKRPCRAWDANYQVDDDAVRSGRGSDGPTWLSVPEAGDTSTARHAIKGVPADDLRHRRAVHRREGQVLHRRVPGRLHLRGRPDALHPPGRVRRLRCVRARLPGGGDLLRGRRPGAVEGVHRHQRRLVRGAGLPRRRRQGRPAGTRHRLRRQLPADRVAPQAAATEEARGAVAMAGADDGFDDFYAACYGRLVGQLFPVTGDLHEAEDVVQEAFVRAAARWSRLREYDLPAAWVRRVAINLAASGLRRARRRMALLSRIGPPPNVPPLSVESLALAEALRALPVSYRQVLVLHHLVGLPLDEVGAQLDLSVSALKARLHRARAALAKLLAPESAQEARRAHR